MEFKVTRGVVRPLDRSEPRVYKSGPIGYITGLIPDYFPQLYPVLGKLCVPAKVTRAGVTHVVERCSCIMRLDGSDDTTSLYEQVPVVPLDPIIRKLSKLVNGLTDLKFDYVMCHVYPSGTAGVGWHADKIARSSTVVSLSFGATRKFRFRKMGVTRGFKYEFELASGDVVIMYPDCQSKYKHSVPVEKRVSQPRINLTFRQLE